jgi:glycosyltransferase involved in cell wall biosynthesis
MHNLDITAATDGAARSGTATGQEVRRPRPRRILYIQHANALSGSVMSLLYTMTALDPERWEPVVALIRPGIEVADLYRSAGIETLEWSGITTVEHTTARYFKLSSPADWLHACSTVASVRRAVRSTHDLLDRVQPDLVHLNSVVLLPSAMALRERGVPWVWHVRESPVHGIAGLRRRGIGHALENWPREVFFISEADRSGWVGSRRGVVVHNFVDLTRFHPSVDGSAARSRLGLDAAAPVVLFLGSMSRLKGVLPLLDALAELRSRLPGVRCVMAGAVYRQSTAKRARLARRILPLLGTGTWSQQVEQRIRRLQLADVCVRVPFARDVAPLIAAADVVVFPALLPHFPRPAMEAGAMGRPVVASRLPGVSEVVLDGTTGLLTPAGDVNALVDALQRILTDKPFAAWLGAAARRHAEERFELRRQMQRITDVYEKVLT